MKSSLKSINNLPTTYKIFLGILATINLLPILAPILLELSNSIQFFTWPARVIYFLYSFTCHQFHHRSIHFFDYQIAWCARDVGIWLGILTAAIYIVKANIKAIPIYWVIPFVVPIALDGGIQTIATVLGIDSPFGVTGDILYVSNNLVRFMTGSFFGLGVGLFLSPYVYQVELNSAVRVVERGWFGFGKLLLPIIPLFLFYAASIGIWQVTSDEVLPSDVLDTAVKTPAEDLFARRLNGACPATTADILDFNCE